MDTVLLALIASGIGSGLVTALGKLAEAGRMAQTAITGQVVEDCLLGFVAVRGTTIRTTRVSPFATTITRTTTGTTTVFGWGRSTIFTLPAVLH